MLIHIKYAQITHNHLQFILQESEVILECCVSQDSQILIGISKITLNEMTSYRLTAWRINTHQKIFTLDFPQKICWLSVGPSPMQPTTNQPTQNDVNVMYVRETTKEDFGCNLLVTQLITIEVISVKTGKMVHSVEVGDADITVSKLCVVLLVLYV